jgi:NitT/TauT family transport system permease protein
MTVVFVTHPVLESVFLSSRVAVLALLVVVASGGLRAALFARSRALEGALFPWAVVLQVTPVVAIAPLILIWVEDVTAALLVCASIAAFFPMLSNTALGLRSADRDSVELFRLYGATRRQALALLLLRSALPFFPVGLRVASGLAHIDAVVAKFLDGAGRAAGSGLAFRIPEAGYRLRTPRRFAALFSA